MRKLRQNNIVRATADELVRQASLRKWHLIRGLNEMRAEGIASAKALK